MLCVVNQRSLRRADPWFRGVLLIVVCHCVWYRNLKNEAALARVGLLRQRRRRRRRIRWRRRWWWWWWWLLVSSFMTISRSILVRVRNASNKSCRENQNTHFVLSNFFSPALRVFMRKCGRSLCSQRGRTWQYRGALHAGLVSLHARKHTSAPVHPQPHARPRIHPRARAHTHTQTQKYAMLMVFPR